MTPLYHSVMTPSSMRHAATGRCRHLGAPTGGSRTPSSSRPRVIRRVVAYINVHICTYPRQETPELTHTNLRKHALTCTFAICRVESNGFEPRRSPQASPAETQVRLFLSHNELHIMGAWDA